MDFFCGIYAVINAIGLTHKINLSQSRGILATCLAELSGCPELWAAFLSNATDQHWLVEYLLGRFCHNGQYAMRVARLPQSPKQLAGFTLKKTAAASFDDLSQLLQTAAPQPLRLKELDSRSLYANVTSFPVNDTEKMLNSRVSVFHRAAKSFEGDSPAATAGSAGWTMETLWPLLQAWLPSKKIFPVSGRASLQHRCLLLRFHRFVPNSIMPLISHWSIGQNFTKNTLNLADCTANKQGVQRLELQNCTLCTTKISEKLLLGLEPESIWFLER